MLAQRSAAYAAALLLASASALSASDTTFVSQGARVRVKFEQEWSLVRRSGAVSRQTEIVRLTGTAADFRLDTLVLLPEGAEEPILIPRTRIDRIEVAQGKKSNWAKGGLYGGIAGVAVGFGVALLVASDCEEACPGVVAAWIGTAVGGFAVGAGIGAASKTDRWVEAQLPEPPPVALNVGKDGSVRLAFSLRL